MLEEKQIQGVIEEDLCVVLLPGVCSSHVLSSITKVFESNRLVFIYGGEGAENIPEGCIRINIADAGMKAFALDKLFSAKTVCCAAPKLGLIELVTGCSDEDFFSSAIIRSVLMLKKTAIFTDFDINIKNEGKFFRKVSGLIDDLRGMGIEVAGVNTAGRSKAADNAPKDLITENDIHQAAARGLKIIDCTVNCIVTPLAKDTAKEKGVDIIRKY